VETQLNLAWELYRARKFEAAVEALTALIASHALVPSAYSKRAKCYQRMGYLDRALADLSRAIELSPTTSGYYFTRGRYRLGAGQLQEACNDFTVVVQLEKAKEEQPFLEAARFFRAETNLQLGRFDHALRDCSEIREDFSLFVSGRMRTRN